jgi:hypothetical protein
MKKLLIIFGLSILMTACSLFENKEKTAIEICQKAKVQLSTDNAFANLLLNAYGGNLGLGENATWLDYANMYAKQEPNKKFTWSAKKTDVDGIYQVSFLDETGWGRWWEVTLEEKIVKDINSNEYLSRKYGHSRFDKDNNFEITDIKMDTLKIENNYNYYSGKSNKTVVYIINASVINKTNKTLIDAKISGKLQVIFKDKNVEKTDDWNSGFKIGVSKYNPWETGTKRNFYIKTDGVEEIYLNYVPEYVFFNVNINAEDPIGFKYDKDIEEYDLKKQWLLLK